MTIRLPIAGKIAIGFGLLIALVAAVFLIAANMLAESRELDKQRTEIYEPSLKAIDQLNTHILRSLNLIEQWVYIQTRDDQREKTALLELRLEIIPKDLTVLQQISERWTAEERVIFNQVDENTKKLLVVYDEIKYLLPDFKSYEDQFARMDAEYFLEQGESVPKYSGKVQEDLAAISAKIKEKDNKASERLVGLFEALHRYIAYLSSLVIVFGIVIAFVTIKSIVSPIKELKRALIYLGKGIHPERNQKISNDEIGDMTLALNKLILGLKRTRDFSSQVGIGNFHHPFEPLSDQDETGQALLKMRDSLEQNERELEDKVLARTNEVRLQKEQVELQKEKVTLLYKDLTSSINYAKRLQTGILPPKKLVDAMFQDNFIFFRPKDIVSGDFYWFKEDGDELLWSAIDCTGHGVPGAFMSLVGHNIMNNIAEQTTDPGQMLTQLNTTAYHALQSSEEGALNYKDGMDMAFCKLNKKTRELKFAGAHNPLLILRNGELIKLLADKASIADRDNFIFEEKTILLEPGDNLYIFSDGFADQFGGPAGKKITRKRFYKQLTDFQHLPMKDQGEKLHDFFLDWKGSTEQVDDVVVIGVKV